MTFLAYRDDFDDVIGEMRSEWVEDRGGRRLPLPCPYEHTAWCSSVGGSDVSGVNFLG